MNGFGGRTAVVTGAGGGIGLTVATRLAELDALVVAVDLKKRPAELPSTVEFLTGDITDLDLAPEAVALATSRSRDGNLDILVNAAGVAWFPSEPGMPPPPLLDGSIADIEIEAWNRVLDINLTGTMLFARAALRVMREHRAGSMVHVSSIAALRRSDGPLDAYQVSKAGVVSLSRAIAFQYGAHGIRSNTVCPGAVETPMTAGIYESDPARRVAVGHRVPLGRVGLPDDVWAAVSYLLSDAASFVTGTDLVVDGGWMTNIG